MQILKKEKLEKVLNKLAEKAEVFLPIEKEEQSGFYSWQTFDKENDILMLDALNVLLSPKNILFPQTEKMYAYEEEQNQVAITKTYEETKATVIFGIRACDVAAIDRFDKAFLTLGYEENYYKQRRENTIIIANACYQPGENCFCESMGINPVGPGIADIVIRDTGDIYIWEKVTAQGEAITESIAEFLESKEVDLPVMQPFTAVANYEGVAEKLKDMFEHPIWDEFSSTCQTCGICTYICPSCYCFDIQVKNWGEEGYRFRCWDSCMFTEYTEMAGGHNPRHQVKQRFRNRFLHKLQYFNERYGVPLCTGCGRCIVTCPAGINMIEIINEIREVDIDA